MFWPVFFNGNAVSRQYFGCYSRSIEDQTRQAAGVHLECTMLQQAAQIQQRNPHTFTTRPVLEPEK